MSISKERAISVARNFANAEYRDSKFGLRIGEAHARFENGGFGHNVLGLGFAHWSVLFDLVALDGMVAVMDPNHVIVLVDAETERAVWFPVM
ncbi:hypothetical protein [Duganella sp. Root198D2]|uniref:hypothetical protein n=1 Tax=Duganella sp. Root198D2 TaxID=1736489 RepID=UPI00070C3BA3|nr:hypothetical protein [Duganella sp. Root198D2]KRB87075.1 hypothetical protein ASE26_06610 [Duganella sp. Root198D2]